MDFLSAQIQELKWGATSPYLPATAAERLPPGLAVPLDTVPRYYSRSSGVNGARTAAITIGDGVTSWGDINGTSEVVLQAAHDALPAAGGRIFLKRGSYTLANDLDWTNTGSVTIEGEEGSIIVVSGGRIHIATTGSIALKNIIIQEGTTVVGILVDTANPNGFWMENVLMSNAAFNLNAALPSTSSFRRVTFGAASIGMAATPLFWVGTTGTVSGTFNECDFFHASMVSASCSLIDCINGTPTIAMSGANFVDCSFLTLLTNVESVNLGYTSNLVAFDRCYFASGLTLCHVRAFGGTNIKFTNCIGMDSIAAFFQGIDVTHVEVSGYLNNNTVAFPAVELVNCNRARIRGCDVKVNSTVSLAGCAFLITCTTGIVEDTLIEGNTIKGDTTKGPPTDFSLTTGIIFRNNGGALTTFSNIRVRGNCFDSVETGIYFANPGVTGIYAGVNVSGNQFTDNSGGLGIALNFKLGVLFGASSVLNDVDVVENCFEGIGARVVDLVAGNPRTAIRFLGAFNNNINILSNVISGVGSLVNTTSDSAGIYLSTLASGSIVGNTVQSVCGIGSWGIHVGGYLYSCTVTGNVFKDINSPTGDAAGINIPNCSDSTLSSNTFNNITSTAGGMGYAILASTITGTIENVSMVGNNCFSGDATSSFIKINVFTTKKVSITGNTFNNIVGAAAEGILVMAAGTGGDLQSITITGNILTCAQDGITVDSITAAVYKNVAIQGNNITALTENGINVYRIIGCTITGNTIHCYADKWNIYCEYCTWLSITGNNLWQDVGTAAGNIELEVGCDNYLVQSNTCYITGAFFTIQTSAAVGGGKGMVSENLISDGADLRVNDNAVGSGTGSPNIQI